MILGGAVGTLTWAEKDSSSNEQHSQSLLWPKSSRAGTAPGLIRLGVCREKHENRRHSSLPPAWRRLCRDEARGRTFKVSPPDRYRRGPNQQRRLRRWRQASKPYPGHKGDGRHYPVRKGRNDADWLLMSSESGDSPASGAGAGGVFLPLRSAETLAGSHTERAERSVR